MRINANFERKPEKLHPSDYGISCEILQIVTLSVKEFDDLMAHPYKKRSYIADYNPLMREYNKSMRNIEPWKPVEPCLLVVCDSRYDGVLIDTEGYDYPRYTSVIPNINGILNSHSMPTALLNISKDLNEIADFIEESKDMITELLSRKTEVTDISINGESFEVEIDYDYYKSMCKLYEEKEVQNNFDLE